MRWFRLYEDILDERKVQSLSADLFKGWINLLALTCRHRGVVPVLADVAFGLRISEADATSLIKSLEAAQLIEITEVGYVPHNWSGRQFESDSSAERVRRHRQKTTDVTLQKRYSNGGVTAAVTPPDTDTDTDTDLKYTPIPPKGADGPDKPPSALDVRFARFWAAYPRKVAKGAAEKAWRKLRPSETLLASILAAIDDQRASPAWTREGGQFIPHPATWLNQKRWEDETNASDPDQYAGSDTCGF